MPMGRGNRQILTLLCQGSILKLSCMIRMLEDDTVIEYLLNSYKYQALIMGSVAFFAVVVYNIVNLIRKNKKIAERLVRKTISTPLRLTLYMLISLYMLQFAVDLYQTENGLCDGPALNWQEQMLESLFSALDTVGVNGKYRMFIHNIRVFVNGIVPETAGSIELWRGGMIVYASLLNFMAPIIGGALALEVISRSFPKVRLGWMYCQFWRPKCFFSELSSASIALAKSIYQRDKQKILIFTDAYVSAADEKKYELLLEAKQLGAVCVRDDLAHLAKPRWVKREFYLMDDNEFENLRTLKDLTEKRNVRFLKDALVYLFVQTDAYVQIEKQINLDLDSEKNKKYFKRKKKPVIIPVNSYRNLVHNLFDDVPLFEPLIRKQDPSQLTLTILGTGTIGTEAFLSAYWISQMLVSVNANGSKTLKPCDVTVNVVSTEPEQAFWSRIDYINPEIKSTVQMLDAVSTSNYFIDPGSQETCKTYCAVRYIQSNVKCGDFWSDFDQNKKALLKTDYYIVALGNDEDNILVADKLHLLVGKKYLEEAARADIAQSVIIAYAVFDSELAAALNKSKRYQTEQKTNIYMHAFGTLTDVYSCDNICMSKKHLEALEVGTGYRNVNHRRDHIADNVDRARKQENGNYNYWSDLSRALHIQYKVFSLGWIDRSVFDYDTNELWVSIQKNKGGEEYYCLESGKNGKVKLLPTDQYHRAYIREICKQYKKIAVSGPEDKIDSDVDRQKADLEAKKYALAWCEHRRWNAFTRTRGYRYTNGDHILNTKMTHKDMELKLHACLVEIPLRGNILPAVIHGKKRLRLAETGKKPKVRSSKLRLKHLPERDALDRLTAQRRKLPHNKNADSFKKYDFYRCDFDDYENLDVLAESIPFKRSRLLRYSRQGKLAGAFYFREKDNWYVPVESTKRLIAKRYSRLDPKKTEHQSVIEKCEAGKVKAAFLYRKEWYVKQSVLPGQLHRKNKNQ